MRPPWAAAAFLAFLALERGAEVVLARRNEAWLRSRGAREHDARFTRWLIAFHMSWFGVFLLEAAWRPGALRVRPWTFAVVVLLLQALRYWCAASLGRHWNTKVLVLLEAPLSRRGPYRVFKHPNYLVVLVELALYPACFGLWATAAVFGTANALVLRRRIAGEELALQMASPQVRGGV